MELKTEWTERIKKWINVLRKDIYTPLEELKLEGFTTIDRLSLDEALSREFKPMSKGEKWGKEWEYLWLRSKFTIPKEAEGKAIIMNINVGGEDALYVNGEEFGARRHDWVRDDIHRISDNYLTKSAVAGTEYELVIEAYAGHEDTGFDYGPVLAGEYKKRPSGELRTYIGDCSFGIWNEDAYQLYMDVKVLWELLQKLPESSLRYNDIWSALKDFTTIVDFEQSAEKRNQDYLKARERLATVLQCKNSVTTSQFYAFGHAHIDVAWMWPLAETERKVLRTFAAQIRHMENYPEYRFLQSQPHLYRVVKELYPKLYEKIKQKVKDGQWIPEGGMWVEPDTNISSGESLIRQFIHGKRFFKEEFGVDSKMLWLPDVFGYSAALPQIIKGCGIEYFSTQKIWWNYNGGETFPYNYFNWVGIDGTSIPTFLHVDYNSDISPGTVIDRWNNRAQKYDLRSFLQPFGYGDGGGGPSRDYLEYIRRENDLEGCPKVKNAHPLEFFENEAPPADNYVGELYLQCHRGVQTTQAKTKKGNRKSELGLREVEFWGAIAKFNGYEYPLDTVDELWKQVLLCQFHDILPGSSIKRVHEEAEALYESVLSNLDSIEGKIKETLVEKSKDLTVLNSLSFERTAYVKLPEGFEGASAGGKRLPVQKTDDGIIAEVQLPACGTVTLKADEPAEVPKEVSAYLTDGGAVLENNLLKVTFGRKGEITSILEKQTGRELVASVCNEFKMYKDIPCRWEAWDIDSNYEFMPVELDENAEFEVVSDGSLQAILRIKRKINNSYLTQDVIIKRNSARVDFDTTINWNELHKLLKVGFSVSYHSDEALHEIQFGYLKRPNHRSRQYDYDRFEVVNHKWTAITEADRGFAVLNDCKYGVNVLGNTINLTLLRSPFSPDPEADRGEQKFVYSFYAFNGSFKDSGIIQQGYDLNCPVRTVAGSREDGSMLLIDKDNIILETLKPAEDGSSDYVIRLYESIRTATSSVLKIKLPCKKVYACNMLEEDCVEIPFEFKDGFAVVPLDFRPFEIKTLRITTK